MAERRQEKYLSMKNQHHIEAGPIISASTSSKIGEAESRRRGENRKYNRKHQSINQRNIGLIGENRPKCWRHHQRRRNQIRKSEIATM